MDLLDAELERLLSPVVTCGRCGIAYPDHGDAGGPLLRVVGGWASPADAIPLRCPGFQWVDPVSDSPTYG